LSEPSPLRFNEIPVGILDSGAGGLSVLREIHALLPGVPLHYLGDTLWCPYGNKSPERIAERVFSLADRLLLEGVGLLVIACNSATIHAVGALRAAYPLPVVGMEPGVKPAAELTRSGVVGVLATEASIAGEKFHQLLSTHARGVRVITEPCPRFVELVEAGLLEGPEVDAAVEEKVGPLLHAGADVLVLGCTHYPFLREAIAKRIPQGVVLVDTGPAVARRVRDLHAALPRPSEQGRPPDSSSSSEPSGIRIATTGEAGAFARLVEQLVPEIAAKAWVGALS